MADREHSGGLFGSIRRAADACLSSVQNRVELLSLEVQEEKQRLVRLLLWTGAALFSAFLAITIITFAVVLLVPSDSRELVLLGFAVLYVIITVVICIKLRNEAKNAPPPLADTIGELKKDVEALRESNQ
jgi:uncharacterized membrane protein YqjE